MKFLVWDPLNESRETAHTFEAAHPEYAVEEWAEDDAQSGEPFQGFVDVLVLKDGDSEPTKLRVHVDYSRDYTVTERK